MPTENRYVAIKAVANNTYAITTDGTIVRRGLWFLDLRLPRSTNKKLVAISGTGTNLLVGLAEDGTIDLWGSSLLAKFLVSAPNFGFVSAAEGGSFAVGIKCDGTLRAWGDGYEGETLVPIADVPFTAVSAGDTHGIALQRDGRARAWGTGYWPTDDDALFDIHHYRVLAIEATI